MWLSIWIGLVGVEFGGKARPWVVKVSSRICEDVPTRFHLTRHLEISKRRFKYSLFGVSFTMVAT
ncbi:hypothetical protein D3C73_1388800 [compost metagenome]